MRFIQKWLKQRRERIALELAAQTEKLEKERIDAIVRSAIYTTITAERERIEYLDRLARLSKYK